MRCRQLRNLVLIGAALFVGACAPSSQQMRSASYGPEPLGYERIVRVWLDENLVDPHSVQDLTIDPPRKGWMRGPSFNNDYGYLCTVRYNAKNRMGGYTGRGTWLMLIADGRVVRATKLDDRYEPVPHGFAE